VLLAIPFLMFHKAQKKQQAIYQNILKTLLKNRYEKICSAYFISFCYRSREITKS
jgi:hypothetical protein